MSMTFKAGNATIHRIVEMECGFTPALEFLPSLPRSAIGKVLKRELRDQFAGLVKD